jgi:uncharacterized membrane protein YqjE
VINEKPPDASPGLLQSLTTATSTLVDMAHVRLELLSADLEEDREHFLLVAAWGLGALFFIGVGTVLLALFFVVLFWETHPLIALGSLAGLFLSAGLAAASLVHRKSMVKPRLFASSLAELAKDLQLLGPRP